MNDDSCVMRTFAFVSTYGAYNALTMIIVKNMIEHIITIIHVCVFPCLIHQNCWMEEDW